MCRVFEEVNIVLIAILQSFAELLKIIYSSFTMNIFRHRICMFSLVQLTNSWRVMKYYWQARDLMSVLQEANQVVNPKLLELAQCGMGFKGKFGKIKTHAFIWKKFKAIHNKRLSENI